MNDDQRLLASAFLDDAVTSGERARVEGDAEVLAEVERLRAVRRELATVEAPAPEARAAAIAAALEVFDEEHARSPAAGAGVAGPRRVHRSRRPAGHGWPRWLLPAAAAVLVVTVGGVVALSDRNEDTDLSSGAGAPADTELATAAMAADETAAASGSAVTPAGGTGEEPDGADADAPAAAETADSAVDAATADLPLLRTPADLVAFARSSVAATEDGTGRDGPACGHGEGRGSARYLTAGGAVAVDVYADPAAGTVTAVAAGTCDVVARATD